MWNFLGRLVLGKAAEGLVLGVKGANQGEDEMLRQEQKAWEEERNRQEHERILEQHRESIGMDKPHIFDDHHSHHSEPDYSTHDHHFDDGGHHFGD
jgi:hypothetical protein